MKIIKLTLVILGALISMPSCYSSKKNKKVNHSFLFHVKLPDFVLNNQIVSFHDTTYVHTSGKYIILQMPYDSGSSKIIKSTEPSQYEETSLENFRRYTYFVYRKNEKKGVILSYDSMRSNKFTPVDSVIKFRNLSAYFDSIPKNKILTSLVTKKDDSATLLQTSKGRVEYHNDTLVYTFDKSLKKFPFILSKEINYKTGYFLSKVKEIWYDKDKSDSLWRIETITEVKKIETALKPEDVSFFLNNGVKLLKKSFE